MATTTKEFAAGGKVLFASAVGTMCGASPIPYTAMPLLVGPVHAEFGWGFRDILLGVTVFGIIASLLAPVFGALADRLGVRRVAIASLAAFGISFAAFALMPPSLAAWYALWAVVGLVGIGSTPVTWSRAVASWFVANRGLALGLMLLGTSIAGLLVPQITQRMIEQHGWRLVFPALALLPLGIALPLAVAWFREPTPAERPPGLTRADGQLAGYTAGQAARGYRFYVLWVSVLMVATAFGGVFINLVEIVKLHGFTAAQGANALGVMALGILVGRLFIGFLLDRFWAPAVLFPALLVPALGCFMLIGTAHALPPLLFAAALLGFTAGAESDLIAYIAARYFGMAHYGQIYGLLYMPFGIGSSISPAIYGAVRDATGSYDAMLRVAILLFAGGGGLLLTLGRYPKTFE